MKRLILIFLLTMSAPAHAGSLMSLFGRTQCFDLGVEPKTRIEACSKLLVDATTDENAANILMHRSLAFLGQGETEKAVEDANSAIRLTPTNGLFYLHRARINLGRGKFSSVVKDYEKAVSLGEEQPLVSRTGYAIALERVDRIDESLGQFGVVEAHEDAAQLAELMPGYLYHFGRAYHKSGQLTAAIESYSRFIEKQPNRVNGFFMRGLAYEERGERSLAQIDYETAKKMLAENPNLGPLPGSEAARMIDEAFERFNL